MRPKEITRTRRTVAVGALVMTLALTLGVGASSAELKLLGVGGNMTLDTADIPAELKPNWELMQIKCSKCHGLDVVLVPLQAGATSNGVALNKASIKAYGIKMLRKPDSGLTGIDLKKILELEDWLFQKGREKPKQ